MPLIGTAFFFSKSPRHLPDPLIKAKLFSIGLLTVLLPILLYFLLRTLQRVNSIHLDTAKERILPLGLNCIIIFIIIQRVLPRNEIIELYCFFIGILLSTLSCLILAVLNFKASIHMIAISGILMFFIAISIHYNKNINGSIALIFLIAGAIGTSRLHLKAHTPVELIIGSVVGIVPQLIMLNYWL